MAKKFKKFKKGDELFPLFAGPHFKKESYLIKKIYRDKPELIVIDDYEMWWVFNFEDKSHTFYIWNIFDESKWIREKRKLKLQKINGSRY